MQITVWFYSILETQASIAAVDSAGQTAEVLRDRYDPLQIVGDPSDPKFRLDSLIWLLSGNHREDHLALLAVGGHVPVLTNRKGTIQ